MTPEELIWLYETGKTMRSMWSLGPGRGGGPLPCAPQAAPRVYAVDHFRGSSKHHQAFGFHQGWSPYPEFQHNTLGRFENASLKRMSSAEAGEDFTDGSADMVFIDGAHEYESVLHDIRLWAPKARRVVSGHDQGYDSVKRAPQEYFIRAAKADQNCGNHLDVSPVMGVARIKIIDNTKEDLHDSAFNRRFLCIGGQTKTRLSAAGKGFSRGHKFIGKPKGQAGDDGHSRKKRTVMVRF
jgi:hypothetical protein